MCAFYLAAHNWVSLTFAQLCLNIFAPPRLFQNALHRKAYVDDLCSRSRTHNTAAGYASQGSAKGLHAVRIVVYNHFSDRYNLA